MNSIIFFLMLFAIIVLNVIIMFVCIIMNEIYDYCLLNDYDWLIYCYYEWIVKI